MTLYRDMRLSYNAAHRCPKLTSTAAEKEDSDTAAIIKQQTTRKKIRNTREQMTPKLIYDIVSCKQAYYYYCRRQFQLQALPVLKK
jgi:hypothetical protein